MTPDTAHICSKGTLGSPQQFLGVSPCSWHQSIWPARFLLLLLFSHSVMSNSLQPHGQQHTRLPCPSLSPRVCSNSCPLSQWCHSTISSSITLFSSCPQSFPASRSFPMCQFFASGGQSTEASASASVLPMNIQGWFPSVYPWPLKICGIQPALSCLVQRRYTTQHQTSRKS